MKHVTILLAALVVVLGVHTLTRADAPAGVQKWEYDFTTNDGTLPTVNLLNEKGKDGWKLISACVYPLEGKSHQTFYFKRPKRN